MEKKKKKKKKKIYFLLLLILILIVLVLGLVLLSFSIVFDKDCKILVKKNINGDYFVPVDSSCNCQLKEELSDRYVYTCQGSSSLLVLLFSEIKKDEKDQWIDLKKL